MNTIVHYKTVYKRISYCPLQQKIQDLILTFGRKIKKKSDIFLVLNQRSNNSKRKQNFSSA